MGGLCSGVLLLLVAACVGDQRTSSSHREPFPQLLHKTIAGVSAAGSNSVFSSYSIGTALSMLRDAANGTSRRQLTDLLGRRHQRVLQTSLDVAGVSLRIFNAFYHERSVSVRKVYRRRLRRQYGALVEPQPFAAAPDAATAAINQRVALETRDKIRHLLPPGDPTRVAVLISAIYFKANWKNAFSPERTRRGQFRTAAGERQQVDMMTSETEYDYMKSASGGFSAIAIPYQDERFQMILVLPNTNASISDVISRMDLSHVHKQMTQQPVVLNFPKFRVKTKLDLKDVLQRLGIREVFTSAADLGRMSADRRLYVSGVMHSAAIETDERGSEAAAATAVLISARSFFTPVVPAFIADRPFLFYVYDVSTSNVLFSGQVSDAAAAQTELTKRQTSRPRQPRPGAGRIVFPIGRPPVSVNGLDQRLGGRGQFRGGEPRRATPAAARPAVHQTAAGRPAARRPSAHQPAARRPTAHQPAARRPTAHQPAARRPSARRPTAHQPAAHRPSDSRRYPGRSMQAWPVQKPLGGQGQTRPVHGWMRGQGQMQPDRRQASGRGQHQRRADQRQASGRGKFVGVEGRLSTGHRLPDSTIAARRSQRRQVVTPYSHGHPARSHTATNFFFQRRRPFSARLSWWDPHDGWQINTVRDLDFLPLSTDPHFME